MTEPEKPSAVSLLKTTEVPALSSQAEAARQRRVVASIDELRAQLARQPVPQANTTSLQRPSAAQHTWVSYSKWTLAALVPMAAALVIWLQRADVRSPLLLVEDGAVTVESTRGVERLGNDARYDNTDNAADVVVTTAESAAQVLLSNRTLVHFSPQTRVHITRQDTPPGEATPGASAQEQRIRLEHGSLSLDSRHNPNDGPLTIVTTHAVVVVRGASFALQIEQSPNTEARTRVVIGHGDVSVWSDGRKQQLTPGQEWSTTAAERRAQVASFAAPSSDIATLAPQPQPDASARQSDSHGRSSDTSTRQVSPRPDGKASTSDLAEQNQLFESAQAARRAGQHDVALKRFVALIRDFPASEQAHNARVEHFRLLRTLGKSAEARRSAQIYLRAYPRGFAAAEARRLTE